MSTPGPDQPYGSPSGLPFAAPIPAPIAHEPWRHEHGEDPFHVLDASGHVPHHREQLTQMIGAPHVVTDRDRMRARVVRVALALVLLAVIIAALAYVVSQT